MNHSKTVQYKHVSQVAFCCGLTSNAEHKRAPFKIDEDNHGTPSVHVVVVLESCMVHLRAKEDYAKISWYLKDRRDQNTARSSLIEEFDLIVQMSLSISSAEMSSSLYLIPSQTSPCPRTPATDHSGSDAGNLYVLTPPEAYTHDFRPSL